jgi:hypothetical protein
MAASRPFRLEFPLGFQKLGRQNPYSAEQGFLDPVTGKNSAPIREFGAAQPRTVRRAAPHAKLDAFGTTSIARARLGPARAKPDSIIPAEKTARR